MIEKIRQISNDKKFVFISSLIIAVIAIIAFFVKCLNVPLLIISLICFLILSILWNFENALSSLLTLFSFQLINFKFDFIDRPFNFFVFILIIFTIIFSIKYIVDLYRKKRKICMFPFIASCVLIIYSFISFTFVFFAQFCSTCMFVILLYLCYVNIVDVNLKDVILFFVLGLFSSTIMSIIFICIPNTRDLIWMFEGRFAGLSGNPNTLQLICSMGIAVLFFSYVKKQIKYFEFLCMSMIVALIGILTMSKAFLVCFSIILILFLIFEVRKDKKIGWIQIGVVALIILFICLIFNDYVTKILHRFVNDEFLSLWDSIFTGRLTIWGKYIESWSSSIISVLFGGGFQELSLEMNPHNTYIYILYHFGIVGALLWITMFVSYFYKKNSLKELISVKVIPIFIAIILAIEECLLYGSITCLIILSMMCLIKNGKGERINDT